MGKGVALGGVSEGEAGLSGSCRSAGMGRGVALGGVSEGEAGLSAGAGCMQNTKKTKKQNNKHKTQ